MRAEIRNGCSPLLASTFFILLNIVSILQHNIRRQEKRNRNRITKNRKIEKRKETREGSFWLLPAAWLLPVCLFSRLPAGRSRQECRVQRQRQRRMTWQYLPHCVIGVGEGKNDYHSRE